MPDPDDLEARLADMAARRVAADDQPPGLTPGLASRSRRRIRRSERAGAALAALVVVALLAGGVVLARSGREQATTVRVGQTPGAATCYPSGIPRALADQVRQLARGGAPIPHVSPRAEVAALPATASPGMTVDSHALGGWVVVISGRNFADQLTGVVPRRTAADSTSIQLDRGLQGWEAAIPADSGSIASLDPIEVSLSSSCGPTTATTTNTTDPRFAPVSSTIPPATTSPTAPARLGGTSPACVGSQVSLTATTDRSTYAAGDQVKVTVTIRNNGPTCENSSPVDLIDSCPQFQVIDSSGKVTYRPLVLCPEPLTIGPVDTGYHRSVTFSWPESPSACGSTTCPTDICPNAACDTHVPAGAYVVTPSDPVFNGLVVHATTIHIT